MKPIIRTMLLSMSVVLLITFLFSALFASLYYFHIFEIKSFLYVNWGIGIIAYATGGFIIGKYTENKVLISTLLCISLFLIIGTVILWGNPFISWLIFMLKLIIFIFVSVLTFVMKKEQN